MDNLSRINMRVINLIVIHCSATTNDRIFSERELETIHRKRGIEGIGYHFYIRQNGDIKTTRPLTLPGAHTRGFNRNSIGICYEGGIDANGNPCDTRTSWQKHSLKVLLKALLMDYPECDIVGHRDLKTDQEEEPDEYCLKECPCFDVKNEFKEILATRKLFAVT